MTKQSIFPRSTFVGFDHMLKDLDYASIHAKDNYPPHNVVKVDDSNYIIELAVAGFSTNELDIEVEDRTLTVTGEHVTQGREYIHRGISTKKFKRVFRLSEHIRVDGADFKDGILSVYLKYQVPENLRPRKIAIDNYEEKPDVESIQDIDESD